MVGKKGSEKKKRKKLKTVKIEPWLHEYLDKQGMRGETFTNIIWRLISLKEITEKQSDDIKQTKKGYEKSMED